MPKTRTRLLPGLLSLVLASAGAAAPAQEELPDLKAEIDAGIRWLRSTQDAQTGAYGGDVETTGLVLVLLAESPRHYKRTDGPFLSRAIDYLMSRRVASGAITDPGDDPAAQRADTRAAGAALVRYGSEQEASSLSSAREFLGLEAGADFELDLLEPADRSAAERLALRRIATRQADGTWSGAGGKVQATARALLDLSHCYPLLKTSKTPKGAKPLPEFAAAQAREVDAAILRGARFLLKQGSGGRFGGPAGPDAGLTAMTLSALLAVPQPRPGDVQEAIDAGLDWLVGLQNEDGSIHDGKLANYITSAAIMALAGGGHERHVEAIARARDFLLQLQADEGEGYGADHPYYGGIGYGGDERPDLANLQMALEALSEAGLGPDDEAFQRALRFLERCQNRSESSDLGELGLIDDGATMRPGDDGGAAYMPGNSPAGYVELDDGTKIARSYGSMSYALLKGYVFSGLEADDPRVAAVWSWLQENYTLDVNPGFEHAGDPTAAYQGLFYYFHTMARALDLFGAEVLVDARGREQHWRGQLCGRLLAMQSKLDGSWVNENAARWWEGNPLLATSYALLTLGAARPR